MKLVYKILLAVILPTIIISAIFILLIRNTLFREVEDRFLKSIEKTTQDYASLLEARLNAISNIAHYPFTTNSNNNDLYNFTDKDIFEILSNSLSTDTLIYGTSVYIDTAYQGDLNNSLFYVYRKGNSYNDVHLKSNTEEYNSYFENNFDWWSIPKKTGKDTWTSPYFDEGVGNSLMITYSHPFFYNNIFIGIVTIDIRLCDIAQLLLIKEEMIEGEYDPNLYVINTTDSIIIYSESKEPLGNFAYPQYTKSTKSSSENYTFLDTIFTSKITSGIVKEKYDNQNFFAFYSRMKTNNWLIINILTDSKAKSSVNNTITKAILLMLMLVIIIVLTILFTSRLITKPISKLSSITFDISKGDYKKINIKRNDEIGVLASNFNLMTNKLNERERSLKDANKKLLVLDEAKNQFLQLISHEIRTPLNGIVGSTHFLNDMIKDPELKDFLDMLQESVDRLDEFSKTALEITQMQTVGKEMEKTSFSLNKVVAKVLESKLPDAEKKQCTFAAVYSNNDNIIGIEDYTIRTVEELVSNAIKFSNENNVIDIITFEDNGKIKLIVSDRGEVIPPDRIEEITKPFGLAKDHYDKDIGLGLAYVQTFLDINDATMEIISSTEKTEITLIFLYS